MSTSTIEEQEAIQVPDLAKKPEPTKKATRAAQKAHVAPAKGKSPDKASHAKKTPKGDKKAASGKGAQSGKGAKAEKPAASRKGSKTAQILELLKRPGGATLQEIMKVSEWQPHSVRGFLSGTMGKKMGLTVESVKGENGQRTYSIKA